MAADMFLKIEGIKGESSDKSHPAEIEILSFSWGVAQNVTGSTSGGGGRTTQRADISDFVVQKTMDAASSGLFYHCAAGKHIPSVVVSLHRAGEDKQLYAQYTLHDVIISNYSAADSAGSGMPSESVSFNFSKVEMKYQQMDAKTGKPSGNFSSGWDLLKNVKI